MPVLSPRHEKFAQHLAAGLTATKARLAAAGLLAVTSNLDYGVDDGTGRDGDQVR